MINLMPKYFHSRFKTLKSNIRGFTLIELMVAISIVAILATIGIVAFGATQKSARDAKRKGDLADIKKALYLYRSGAGTFCPNPGGCVIGGWGTTVDGGSDQFNTKLQTAIGSSLKGNVVPLDPTFTGNSQYTALFCGTDQFTICAKLEGSAPALNSSSFVCPPLIPTGGGQNYCVSE